MQLTFRPPTPGNPAGPGSPWGAEKKCLEFPHNVRRCILLYLILPVLLAVQSQALLSHPSAAGFGPGCRGWGWLGEKGSQNTALPAARCRQSRVALRNGFPAWQNCFQHEAIQPQAQLKHTADLFSFGAIKSSFSLQNNNLENIKDRFRFKPAQNDLARHLQCQRRSTSLRRSVQSRLAKHFKVRML